jgi:molybdenum cofactor cytidylyltransferase
VITGLLLAAGGARRFGRQKLVATLDGIPLVVHAANALSRVTDGLVIVIGHEADAVRAALVDIEATIVENGDWSTGLASSVRCGVAAAPAGTEAIVIALGDQPDIDSGIVARLIERWRETGRPIVAAKYRGQRGHPVLFERSMFAGLARLTGDVGARDLIDQSPDAVAYVEVRAPVPPDIDTPSDLDGFHR